MAILASPLDIIQQNKYYTYYMKDNKNETISKIYNDLSGFGSIKQTFEEARHKDKTITLNDVKEWKENNIVRKQS